MSNSTPTPEELAQQIASGGPIVSEATQAVGKLFTSTFATLTQNIQDLIKSNSASGPMSDAVNTLTTDMIKLLASRVSSAFPGGGGSSGDAAAAPAAGGQTPPSGPSSEPSTPS